MTAQTAPAPVEQRRRDDIEPLVHTVCHNPNKALCGEDLTDGEETEEVRDCVVCIDLVEAGTPCSRLCRVRSLLWWHLRGRWTS